MSLSTLKILPGYATVQTRVRWAAPSAPWRHAVTSRDPGKLSRAILDGLARGVAVRVLADAETIAAIGPIGGCETVVG